MTRKIEEQLISGFDQIAPNTFADIKANINKNSDRVTIDTPDKSAPKTKPAKKKYRNWLALAAALLLVMTCLLGSGLNSSAYAGEIYIDSSESIILQVDKDNQVCDIKAGNAEAEKTVAKLKAKLKAPVSAKEALELTLKNVNCDNGMVISYCYKEENCQNTEQAIREAASECLDQSEYVIQTFKDDKELTERATEKAISPGKCHYIEKLSKECDVDLDEYAHESIHEIHKVTETKHKDHSQDQDQDKEEKKNRHKNRQGHRHNHTSAGDNTTETSSSYLASDNTEAPTETPREDNSPESETDPLE